VNSEEKPKKRTRRKAPAEGAVASKGEKPRTGRGKKRTTQKARVLIEAPHDKVFWLMGGSIIVNLRELRDVLESQISDEQFAHHVGPGRNDFACWVEDVLEDSECARALRESSTREEAARAVTASLVAYEPGSK